MRKKALKAYEREIMVINWFAIRIQHDNDDWASMSEIAKGIGLSPSSHLRKILSVMVGDGALEICTLNRPGRWAGWGYRLARGTFQRPRQIKFTSRGVSQMEMFGDDYSYECSMCGKDMPRSVTGRCSSCERIWHS